MIIEIFCEIIFTVFIALMLWIVIGCFVLTPFAAASNKIGGYQYCYSKSQETLKQAVTWPYVLYKIYKLSRKRKLSKGK